MERTYINEVQKEIGSTMKAIYLLLRRFSIKPCTLTVLPANLITVEKEITRAADTIDKLTGSWLSPSPAR